MRTANPKQLQSFRRTFNLLLINSPKLTKNKKCFYLIIIVLSPSFCIDCMNSSKNLFMLLKIVVESVTNYELQEKI